MLWDDELFGRVLDPSSVVFAHTSDVVWAQKTTKSLEFDLTGAVAVRFGRANAELSVCSVDVGVVFDDDNADTDLVAVGRDITTLQQYQACVWGRFTDTLSARMMFANVTT